MDKPTWQDARKLLGAYDGEASELFVLDIPAERYDSVLSAVAVLPSVVVEVIAGATIEPPAALDEELLQRMRRPVSGQLLHMLCSARDTADHLQVLISKPDGDGRLDVEFVFWNDLTFPDGLLDAEYSRRLDRLVSLADECRGGSAQSRCILSTEHNGEPRKLLSNPHVIIW